MAKEPKATGATVVLNLGAKAAEDKMKKKAAPAPEMEEEGECCPECGAKLS